MDQLFELPDAYHLALLSLTETETVIIFAFLGLIIGSFLNVVIYRLPKMIHSHWHEQALDFLEMPIKPNEEKISLLWPPSYCPQCQHQIRFFENIPVISWLLLRRKCSACQINIPIRYPAVEIISALLSAFVAYRFGPSAEGLLMLVVTFHLIIISAIDLDHQLIPDSLVLPLLWLVLICSVLGIFQPPSAAIMGAVVGYLCLWSISKTYKLIRHVDGMGHGDFKLLAVLGAICGWQSVFIIVAVSAFIGLVFALPLLLKNTSMQTAIPFGPALAIAGWITIIFAPL
jgi:leader peptidase (prepilin peptidase)/N-methyltransferase